MTETYNLRFTNRKNTISIESATIDRSTSLALHGKNSIDVVDDLNRNMLLLLGHFANPIAPLNPIKGQIWFDNVKKEIRYFDDVWQSITSDTLDLTGFLAKRDDTSEGNIEIQYTDFSTLSMVPQSYANNKKMEFNSVVASDMSWVRYSNGYFICSTYATTNGARTVLPFIMNDSNYSVLITPYEPDNNFNTINFSIFNKNTSGFNIATFDVFYRMSIVVMGFATDLRS